MRGNFPTKRAELGLGCRHREPRIAWSDVKGAAAADDQPVAVGIGFERLVAGAQDAHGDCHGDEARGSIRLSALAPHLGRSRRHGRAGGHEVVQSAQGQGSKRLVLEPHQRGVEGAECSMHTVPRPGATAHRPAGETMIQVGVVRLGPILAGTPALVEDAVGEVRPCHREGERLLALANPHRVGAEHVDQPKQPADAQAGSHPVKRVRRRVQQLLDRRRPRDFGHRNVFTPDGAKVGAAVAGGHRRCDPPRLLPA